jgi:hypothetical protein
MIARAMLDDYGVDHVLVLVPWVSIQGDAEKGMLGAFGQLMGLDARDRFFTLARRQPRQPRPQMDATITLYQEVCNQQAIETLKMWKADGFTFGFICDEIHHTNEINSSWGAYVEQIQELAAYSVFMSGTYFRGDKKPISCIPRDDAGIPIKHYRFPYAAGVKEGVVRSVTTRDINANVVLYDKSKDRKYELNLKEVSNKELSEAKKQVLDPQGECVRNMIETAHGALIQTRTKFPDAACLFVCRPGSGDNYTRENGNAIEDRHVHLIARQIRELTGETPTVVTHKDRDAVGKIARFRRGSDPYLVAVNMVSEGCDIPRLRAVAFCRYTTSEMLFRQIVGRALRTHTTEDGTAAQIYIPAFPLLVEFAQRLYGEAQEGIRDRRCQQCGEWPCQCPCPDCAMHPCICPDSAGPLFDKEPVVLAIDAIPVLDGGHLGPDHVGESFVALAYRISQQYEGHRHANHTQLGHAIQVALRMQQQQEGNRQAQTGASQFNPGVERERLRRQINRHVRRLAINLYEKDYATAYRLEVETPFGAKFSEIINTWGVDRLREVADRLERRIVEVFRG